MRISEIQPGQKRNVQINNPTSFEHVWNKLIKPNCKEALRYCYRSGDLMFRGFNGTQPIIRGRSFENRRPLSSDPVMTQEFDKRLAALGFKALRKNSIFVTSNSIMASDFGKPYIIFPIDGFDYTYCVGHNDLNLGGHDMMITPNYDWLDTEDLRAFKDEFQPYNTHLEVALKKGYEIYIHGQYYALRHDLYIEHILDQHWGNDENK